VPVWLMISVIVAAMGWAAPASPAPAVAVHPFGRYEILLQEGTPVALSEVLGVVHRQTGLPEYPLMLGIAERQVELQLLGPGNRPYRLASAPLRGTAVGRAGAGRFIVQRSTREGERLAIQLRHISPPASARLVVDLQRLERLLEGER
jgi:hypothetical protein